MLMLIRLTKFCMRCFLLCVHLNDDKIKHFVISWGEVECSLCFINIIMFIVPEHQGNWGMQNNTVRILKTLEFTYSILYPIRINLYFHLPYWSLWVNPIFVSPMRFSKHIFYLFIIYYIHVFLTKLCTMCISSSCDECYTQPPSYSPLLNHCRSSSRWRVQNVKSIIAIVLSSTLFLKL